jgi:hypothetical protein
MKAPEHGVRLVDFSVIRDTEGRTLLALEWETLPSYVTADIKSFLATLEHAILSPVSVSTEATG